MWTGRPAFTLTKALIHANVKPNEFYDHWKARAKSIECITTGKKELLEVLEKAGLRQSEDGAERLKKQIWFVNEIVGPEKDMELTKKVDMELTKKVGAE